MQLLIATTAALLLQGLIGIPGEGKFAVFFFLIEIAIFAAYFCGALFRGWSIARFQEKFSHVLPHGRLILRPLGAIFFSFCFIAIPLASAFIIVPARSAITAGKRNESLSRAMRIQWACQAYLLKYTIDIRYCSKISFRITCRAIWPHLSTVKNPWATGFTRNNAGFTG